MLEATGGGNSLTPPDLATSSQGSAQSATNKNYYDIKIPNLKLDKSYIFKFQWAFEDGTLSEWSPGYIYSTPTESVPVAPTTTVPANSVGSIPVTLSSYPANAKRVDIYVIGGEFGTGKVADYFLAAGTKNIAVAGGTYQVSLITVTPSGVNGDPTETFTINVSIAGESIQAPTNPTGFSSKRILAGIEVSWDGTYSNSTFTGFNSINIYAGSSATATTGTYEQVGVLTANNVKNTIVVPVGTYVAYGQPVYIHAAAVNKNGVVGAIQANVTNQPLGPGKATDADINDGAVVIEKLASNVLTVGNLKAGDINATSYIRAGSASSARVELSSAQVGSVNPGFYIYNSAGTPVLSAPLSGGLSITGGGSFTGDISGASGTFTGNISASNGLFSVSNGVLTAQSGTIGNWQINSNTLRSGAGTNRIILNPDTPSIELYSSTGNIFLNTTEGLYNSAGTFSLTPGGVLTVSGDITGGTFTLKNATTTNYWTTGGFNMGAGSNPSTQNTAMINYDGAGTITLVSGTASSGSDTNSNPDGGGSSVSSISVSSRIILNSSGLQLRGIPTLGDYTRYNYPYNYYTNTDSNSNNTSYGMGSAARLRTLIQDPYDHTVYRGFAVYYGSRTNAPGGGTGYVGDLWVSW